MSEHTPTPWYTDDPHIVAASVGDDIVYLANTNDLDTDYETSVVNAAHIVRCVNCHDELVEALKACEAMVSSDNYIPNWDWVRSVIAKASA